jgi:hypothetical protein
MPERGDAMSAKLSVRSNFAIHHLRAAIRDAHNAHAVEQANDTSALDFRRRSSRCDTVQCGPVDDRNLPIWVNHASRQSGSCPIPAARLIEVAAGTLDCSAVGMSPRPEQV